MKTKFTLLVLVLILAIAEIQAQKEFHLFMTLSMDQTMQKAFGNTKVTGNDVYAVGAFKGIASSVPNGQLIGFGGIIKFPDGNLNNPQPLGGGIQFPEGTGLYDVASLNGSIYVVGENYSSEKLFRFDDVTNEWDALSVTVESGAKFTFVDSIAPSTFLLVGTMQYCNNILVNGICTYNVQTGVVSPVGTGLLPYSVPTHFHKDGDKRYISGGDGKDIYCTSTGELTHVAAPVANTILDFKGHGDTMYIIAPGGGGSIGTGDLLYQKIGNGDWKLLCYADLMTTASIQFNQGKVHVMGISPILYGPDNIVYPGGDLAVDEQTGAIVSSGVTTVQGMQEYIKLPNSDDYIGWSDGNLFTTRELATGVEKITDNTLKLYPNPTSAFVTISGLHLGDDILITDIAGKTILLQKSEGENFVFNTDELLVAGLYFVNKKKLLVVR